MTIHLQFGHDANGNATAKMAIGESTAVAFDYVELVKHLFVNSDVEVVTEIDESYNEGQQEKLKALAKAIEETARGNAVQDNQISAESDNNKPNSE